MNCFSTTLFNIITLKSIIFPLYKCIITAPVVPTACLRVRYTKYAFTRLVDQPPAYASGALIKY